MVVKGDEKNRVRDVSVFKMGRLAPSARAGDRADTFVVSVSDRGRHLAETLGWNQEV